MKNRAEKEWIAPGMAVDAKQRRIWLAIAAFWSIALVVDGMIFSRGNIESRSEHLSRLLWDLGLLGMALSYLVARRVVWWSLLVLALLALAIGWGLLWLG